MTEERKHAILFAATILAVRKLAEIGDKPCPAREAITTGDDAHLGITYTY